MKTPDLIDALAADAAPVKRLRPPLIRATLWLAAYVTVLGLAVWIADAWAPMQERLQLTRFALEMTGTVLTGIAAIIAAFYLSVPDRSRTIALLAVPPLLLWLAMSGYGCLVNLGGVAGDGWARSSDCVVFIVGLSVPLGVALHFALRRAIPLDPLPVLAAGGLGVAALAAAALQFFHPFDVTVIDLALHVVAVSAVIAVMTFAGGRTLRLPA